MMENTLRQIMAGASRTLQQEGMQLIGGHTAEGAELSLSLTVNGFIAANTSLTKGGMREGDVLVLSKPLGTGTLFAARMHQQARGAWIEHALDIMQQSNGPAARRLRERGAHAATDVTGFGLLGHLLEMCAASDCGATLVLDQLPALPGALDCLAAGIESTLAPENRRFADRLINAADFSAHPKFALLFDPQTSGGLLAALPADSDTGELTVIGTVTASRTITLQ
jgi:selenide,water dikinase